MPTKEEPTDQEKNPNLLERVDYVNVPEIGNMVVSEDEITGAPDFTVYLDSQERPVMRHDFDKNGRVKKVTITTYDEQGAVSQEDHLALDFYRQRNSKGILQEFSFDGTWFRDLQE